MAFGTKALYADRDYGGNPGVYPNPRSSISNRSARTHGAAYGGDQPIDWVYDCVGLIMETASNAEFYFERDGKRMKKPDDTAGDKDALDAPKDLCGLLESPNPYMDYVEHIELSIIDLLLAGEFIWLKYGIDDEGKPQALYRLSPALVEVVADPNKFISRYEYTPPGASEPLKFRPEEIIHAKMPNPHNPYRGLGRIAGGPRTYDVELATTESLAQYYEQGTKLTGVLSSERRVPEPVFNRIRRQFANMYSGARNAYKVAVLESGLRFSPLQSSAADAQYDNLSRLSRDRILAMFRVPKPLLGNMEDSNYKMAEAQRVFDTKTMRPLLNRIERIITKGLTEAWDVRFRIDYQYVMPDEDRLKLAEVFATLPGVKVSEVRKQAGLDPLGTDEDNIVLNMPPTPEEKAAELAAKFPPLGAEGGRPPLPGNRPPGVPAGAGQPRRRGTLPTSQARIRERASQRKALDDVQERLDPLRTARVPTIELLAYNIGREIADANRQLERELERVILGDQKAVSDIIKRVKGARAWRTYTAALTTTFGRYAKDALDAARNQLRLIGFEPEPDVDFDAHEVANALVMRENGVKSIVGTLKERVIDQIAEGINRNYSTEQIVNGVSDEDYDGLKVMMIGYRQGQIETIAATEAQEYYNEGAIQVAEAAEHGYVMVTDGEDFDEPCVEANGQVWTIDEARARRTEHPNCRRTFYPVSLASPGAEPAASGKAMTEANTMPPKGIQVNVEPTEIPAPIVNVPAPVVNVPAPIVNVEAPAPEKPTKRRVTVSEDAKGQRVYEISE